MSDIDSRVVGIVHNTLSDGLFLPLISGGNLKSALRIEFGTVTESTIEADTYTAIDLKETNPFKGLRRVQARTESSAYTFYSADAEIQYAPRKMVSRENQTTSIAYVVIEPFEALVMLTGAKLWVDSGRVQAVEEEDRNRKFAEVNKDIVFVPQRSANALKLRGGSRVGLVRDPLNVLSQNYSEAVNVNIRDYNLHLEEKRKERSKIPS